MFLCCKDKDGNSRTEFNRALGCRGGGFSHLRWRSREPAPMQALSWLVRHGRATAPKQRSLPRSPWGTEPGIPASLTRGLGGLGIASRHRLSSYSHVPKRSVDPDRERPVGAASLTALRVPAGWRGPRGGSRGDARKPSARTWPRGYTDWAACCTSGPLPAHSGRSDSSPEAPSRARLAPSSVCSRQALDCFMLLI